MPTLAFNKRARYDYEILDEFEGGLLLTGGEVRSIRQGHAQMQGAFLYLRNGELWLKNMYVAAYAPAGPLAKESSRDRKVLLHKRELNRLFGKLNRDRLTLVPLSLYTRGTRIKIGFALAKGKQEFEKRETIKKRDIDRQLREHLKE